MARQVTTTIQGSGGASAPGEAFSITNSGILAAVLTQTLFDHHSLSVVVSFDSAESTKADFLRKTPVQLLGKSISLVVEPKADFNMDKEPGFTFKGIVTEMGTTKESDAANSITVQAYGPSCMMMDGMQKRTFVDQTLKSIFERVLAPYPSNVLVKKLKPLHTAKIPYAVQYQETNFGFLSRLASEYGEWFYYDGNTLTLGLANEGAPLNFVADGVSSGFHVGLTLHPTKVKFYEYDYVNHEHYTGSTAGEQVAFVGNQLFGDLVLAQADELFKQESHSAAEVPARSESEVRGEARNFKAQRAAGMIALQGYSENTALQVGRSIHVSGTGLGSTNIKGNDFGTYRLVEVVHRLDTEGNYSNTFTAIPSVHDTPPLNPHHEPPAGVAELAEVIDVKDPQGLGRIRVRYYWPTKSPQDAETALIRVLTPYSGDGKGQLFTPEVGSQVLIGYENGLAEQPYVQGNFFHANNSQKAKYTTPNNHLKGLQTAGGNKVVMSDKKGEQTILLSNSNNKGTAIAVSFKGDGSVHIQSKGPVTVNGSVITLEAGSKGEIKLHAKNITIDAEENINLKSGKQINADTQDHKVEATNSAKLAGKMKTDVEGGMVTVAGQQMVDVKGLIVKINS